MPRHTQRASPWKSRRDVHNDAFVTDLRWIERKAGAPWYRTGAHSGNDTACILLGAVISKASRSRGFLGSSRIFAPTAAELVSNLSSGLQQRRKSLLDHGPRRC